MEQLSEKQIHSFINDGFVKIDQAFPTNIADECRAILWEQTSCNPNNPDTWTAPVIRIGELGLAPFQQAANTALLHTAFNQLAGKDNWLPSTTIGSFPIRFPSAIPATDTGWHVDASFPGEDATDYFKWRINVHSRGRALLMLFLFSDVSEQDAPTLIKVGSHADVARLLAPEGDHGLSFMELAEKLDILPARKTITATGKAGTVYLCHPFIVHAAQDHHGKMPKFMAQPPLLTKHDFDISTQNKNYCPVEMAIVNALGS
jgi:hypothetical protein